MVELSIVMGTYNRYNLLKKCLSEVLTSAKKINIEIIINDGGSTDGTVEYIKKLSSNNDCIVPIFNNKLTGITNAYNECFFRARGEFLIWLSDDTIPVGNSLENMYNMMKSLSRLHMGAFKMKNGPNAKYNFSKIRGFLCPEISCVRTKILQEMGGWNTDYPYYGQDNEFDARFLRRGGKIVACENAYIDHLNYHDGLKNNNLEEYKKGGHGQKFQIIYFHRYGIVSNCEFPIFAIAPLQNVSKERIIETIKRIYSYYKNMNYYLFESRFSNKIFNEMYNEINSIKIVPWKIKSQWYNFDLIVVIGTNNKHLYSGNGTELTKEFAKELLK